MWGRWIALGAALTGVSNFAVFVHLVGLKLALMARDASGFFLVSLALLASLGGPRMAAHFTEHLPPNSIWRRRDLRVKLLSAAIVTSLSAVAMMLLFGMAVQVAALNMVVAAAIVSAGACLVAAGRALGVILVGASAIGASVVAFILAEMAHGTARSGLGFTIKQSAMFTYPSVALAAVTGAFAFAVFAKTMLRFVLRPAD
jgi:hypothetical protein